MRFFITANVLAAVVVLAMVYGPLYLYAQYVAPVGVL